jgi:hypothetical protein
MNSVTILHVVLSLIGIGSGVGAIYRLLKAKTPGGWTRTFLATTAATSLTGLLFQFHGVTPAQVLGVLSLIAVIIASLSMFRYRSQGIWRWTYAITAVMAFNVFVLVVQLFRERHCPDPVGGAFPDSAARRAADVRGDWNSRRARQCASRACPVIHQSHRSLQMRMKVLAGLSLAALLRAQSLFASSTPAHRIPMLYRSF